jgi:hypothetical protein
MFCRKVLLPVEEGLYVVVLDGEDIGWWGLVMDLVISINMLKRVRCLCLS